MRRNMSEQLLNRNTLLRLRIIKDYKELFKNKLNAADQTGRSTEIVKILEMEDILEKEVKDLL